MIVGSLGILAYTNIITIYQSGFYWHSKKQYSIFPELQHSIAIKSSKCNALKITNQSKDFERKQNLYYCKAIIQGV